MKKRAVCLGDLDPIYRGISIWAHGRACNTRRPVSSVSPSRWVNCLRTSCPQRLSSFSHGLPLLRQVLASMVNPKFSARRGWPLSYDNDPDRMLKVALHQQKQDLETQVQGPGTSAPPLPTQIGPQGSLIENQV